MNNIERNQEQIDALLKEALDFKGQVMEIAYLSEKVSEKFEHIGNIIHKSSKSVGKFAKNIAKGTRLKGMSKEVGQIAEVGTQIIAEGIKSVGAWYTDRKERKILEKLLPQKQEIARAKLDTIIRLLPKIEKGKKSIISLCKNEASTMIDYNDKQRHGFVSKSASDIFEAYFNFEQTEQMCKFLLAEFRAWLKGEHQSDEELKQASIIYLECVNDLIKWSQLPKSKPGFDLPSKLSIGGYLLLADKQITEYSYSFNEVSELAAATANKRILSAFLPFGAKVKEFKKFYSEYLKNSESLTLIIKKKRTMIFWFTVSLILLIFIVSLFLR
ncbi:MAG: hypothetical protein WC755_09725 [Candidatus Woesearchaeota archaeon]